MAGRTVRAPKQVHSVYCMNPACAMVIYSLAPEKLLSFPIPLSDKERSYLAPPLNRLQGPGPVAGDAHNPNTEQLLKLHPDMIVLMEPGGSAAIERLNQLQDQTHIPTFLFDMTLRNTPEVYRTLGTLLGVEKRAEQLARYSRSVLDDADAKVRSLPADKRPRVYIASGANGLQTVYDGAPHAEAIPLAGGVNVARSSQTQHAGHIVMAQSHGQAAMEQVLAWNPSVILVVADRKSNVDLKKFIDNDPLWKTTAAVRNHAVYRIPAYPFAWVSGPASINRLIGVRWLGNLLRPDVFRYDMRKETRQFYALFYHKKLSEEELNELLDGK